MRKIGFKLWIGMMLLVGVVLILIWMFQIVFLEEFYFNMQASRLMETSEAFVKQLEKTEISQDTSIVNDLESFSYINHVLIEVTDLSGKVLFEAAGSNEQQYQNMFRKALLEARVKVISGDIVQTTMTHPRFGNTYLVIGIPIGTYGIFIMNAPLAPVEATKDILAQQMIYISMILILAASLLAMAISRHFTKPIKILGQAAGEIAKGCYETKIELKRQDEIGKLGEDLSKMVVALGQTDRLRKELIGNISHELRTPLSLIRGYAETIRDVSGESRDKREKHLGFIIEATLRLSRLIEDVLSLSKIEAGAVKMEQEDMALGLVVKPVLEGFEDLAQKRNIQLVYDISETVWVRADKNRMEQVFYNLIGNAFKFTPEGGHIRISAQEVGKSLKITVEDDGSGMSQEVAERIWDRYYKGEAENQGAVVGTGLGLAIVRSILVAHGAPFGVWSREGVGTRIWFELPEVKGLDLVEHT